MDMVSWEENTGKERKKKRKFQNHRYKEHHIVKKKSG